ncbi:MAG: damage-inducible protein DinB [Acidobacteria bacterium]|nr:damage-inducible protein DinB [Acidobacteriota bacterium]
MDHQELLRQLCAHMEWADAKVWSAILAAEEARDDARLRDKLRHLHETQQQYLGMWTGRPPRSAESADSLAAVHEWAQPFYAAARSFVDATGAEAMAGTVSGVFAERMQHYLGPPQGTVTLADTVVQVVTHTTHHRGQVMTRLREIGGEPPLVDYVIWLWSGKPAAAWNGPSRGAS